MDILAETSKREEFKKILKDLAVGPNVLKEAKERAIFYKRLEDLYYDPETKVFFRHFYSDIFMVLAEVTHEPNLGNIMFLGANLQLIRNGYKAKNFDVDNKLINISICLKKLSDHVSLEIARLNYNEAEVKEEVGETSINDLNTKVNSLNKKASDFDEKIGKMEKELDKSKSDYITILGIFSSVVLSFTAGIAFSTSVLENIDKVSTYRLIFVSCIIGLVLLNIIFALFYYIGTLTGKEGKVQPIFIANIVFIIIMLLTILAWDSGAIEKRNKRYENISSGNETVATTQTYSKTSDQ